LRYSAGKRRPYSAVVRTTALAIVVGLALGGLVSGAADAQAQRLTVVVEAAEGPALEDHVFVVDGVSEHLRARAMGLDLPRLLVSEGVDSLAQADLILQFEIRVHIQGIKVTALILDASRNEQVLRLPSIAPHGSIDAMVTRIDDEIFPGIILRLMAFLKIPDRPMLLADCIFANQVEDSSLRSFALAVGAGYGAELLGTKLPARFEIMTLDVARYHRWCQEFSDDRVHAHRAFDAALYGFLDDVGGPWLTVYFRQGDRKPQSRIQLDPSSLDASIKVIARQAEVLADAP
jgi:hypothetical protein